MLKTLYGTDARAKCARMAFSMASAHAGMTPWLSSRRTTPAPDVIPAKAGIHAEDPQPHDPPHIAPRPT